VRTLPRWEDRNSGLTDNERRRSRGLVCIGQIDAARSSRQAPSVADRARGAVESGVLVLDAVEVEAGAARAGRRRRLNVVSELSSR
jgi:hypothetical protein